LRTPAGRQRAERRNADKDNVRRLEMGQLSRFNNLDIDWEMTPEQAVVLYLEWGNNDWHADFQPVRFKSDQSVYFVVNTWEKTPKVMLIQRNSEEAKELATLDLPASLAQEFAKENGYLKGVFEPTEPIKAWLKAQLEN
jgi:hypothetical protein